MGATNNSLVKLQDIVRSGGIKTENFSIDENKLLKDIEITTRQQQETGQVHSGPLCYNVTLKNEYGNDHLTKFQDLDIAKTYPITLQVTLPSEQWTGYTLFGFSANVTYPNGAIKNKSISITGTTNKNIVLENCCDNAKVKVSASFRSGATISTTAKTVNADVAINSLFTEDDGLICTGTNSYSCFTLTQGFTPGGPVITGDVGTKRSIVISINTTNISSDNNMFIENAKYATGTTSTEVEDHNSLTWFEISELSFKDFSGLPVSSAAVKTIISVPAKSYVAIYLRDPIDKRIITTYKWKEGNYQYIQPSPLTESVTYTVTIKN